MICRWCFLGLGLSLVACFISIQADVTCFSTVSRAQFDECISPRSGLAIYWRLDVTAKTIRFGINVVVVPGWVGVGVSEGSAMKGADLAVMQYSDATQQWQIGDYYSMGFEHPTLDDHQDVQLLGQPGTRPDGTFFAAFQRPLDSCDSQDLAVLYDVDTMVLYAFGGPGQPFSYHGLGNRGYVTLRLWPSPAFIKGKADASPTGMKKFTVALRNYTIPAVVTTYVCMNVMLPSDIKYHIIRAPGFTGHNMTHHMVLYACLDGTSFTTPPGVPYNCLRTNSECAANYLGWAPGSPGDYAVTEAALPVGKGSIIMTTLQIHYTNPLRLTNQVDPGSGFDMLLTRKLRKYDMGVMQLGVIGFSIPPGFKNYTIPAGICAGGCTKKFNTSLVMVGNDFHMHMTGASITTRHIRNGVELPPLGVRRWFDFYWQSQTSVLAQSRRLLPGDSLITLCTYDTSARGTTTRFGLSSFDEMCFNYLKYYPAQPHFDTCVTYSTLLGVCSSQAKVLKVLDNATMAAIGPLLQDGSLYFLPKVSATPYAEQCLNGSRRVTGGL